MAKTEEQELSEQIERLYSELKRYKKALVNPPSWVNTKILADTIYQLEAEISELNAQLESHLLILMMFNCVTAAMPNLNIAD
ncbi:MAG TPA: hypothetical protein DCE56_30195 [Cyanobacteria bacterium UBA8553]|nr:hypothetical protein [Cyanobacteria bacterium UBA8553]HAJ61044.1 hypothetical protein [Cyanobacteria bacterium UBA8543]